MTTENKISNQYQAIIHFIEKMDIEMVDAFLDSDKMDEGFDKYRFISKLQEAFAEFKEFGDTYLLAFEGNCNSCDETRTGFTFVGNYSCNYMSIIFDTTENRIDYLCECIIFKNKHSNLILNKRIFIDLG